MPELTLHTVQQPERFSRRRAYAIVLLLCLVWWVGFVEVGRAVLSLLGLALS